MILRCGAAGTKVRLRTAKRKWSSAGCPSPRFQFPATVSCPLQCICILNIHTHRFRAWLRETGFWWDDKDLDLRASGTINAGGVFAKRDIPVGRTCVKIPKSGCITWRTSSLASALEGASARPVISDVSKRGGGSRASRGVRASKGRGGGLSDVPANVKLILCLIHEIHLGLRSPWEPYLVTIPDFEAGIPLLWPKAEAREFLRGTEVSHAVSAKPRCRLARMRKIHTPFE